MSMKLAISILIPTMIFAQSERANLKADEAAIRDLIAHPQQVKPTEDSIFWSGAYPRPIVRPLSEQPKPFSAANMEKRKNQAMSIDVQRIDIASSGDMAYEFSYGKLEYDLEGATTQHVAFPTGVLRVWKKVRGQWRVAATFVRPLDTPFASPPAASR